MRTLLIPTALSLLLAVTAHADRCMDAGDKALFAVESWDGLGAWITGYPECDDGYLAERVSTLVGEWLSAGPEQFAALARAAKTTPRLLDLAARHIDMTLGRDTADRIRAHADYRCPDGAASVCRRVIESLDALDRELIQLPKDGPPVRVKRRTEAAVAGDSTLFARSASDPLVFSPAEPAPGQREPLGTVAVWRDGALQPVGQWPISYGGVYPRAPLGDRDPYVVLPGGALLGYATERLRALRYSELLAGTGVEKAIELPTGLRSPLLLRAGMRLFAAGYTFERKKDGVVAGPAGLGEQRAHNLAIYDLASGKPVMLAIRERLSEHAESNLAAAVAKDGVVHIIATEVLVSRDNASRVLHLRFDPHKRAWLDERVLLHRSEFTSSNTPQLVADGGALDAFWLPHDGRDKGGATDGLYAHRLDSYAVWRLTETDVQYAVLPDADGRGAMLAGVHEGDTSRVRWFLRRNDQWRTAGETDLGAAVYTSTFGTDPFALWRDRAGAVHAAFMGDRKVIVVELTLPD